MKLLGTGRTAQIFEYSSNRVVKRFYSFVPIEDVLLEAVNCALAKDFGIRTPKCYGIEEGTEYRGLIYEKINGHSLLMEMAKVETVQLYQRIKEMAELHYQIHSCTITDAAQDESQTSLPQIQLPQPSFSQPSLPQTPHQKEALQRMISACSLLDPDEKDIILNHLSTLPDASQLLHGDFHPDNILLQQDELWIVDWLTAKKGHPLGDVARTYLLIMYGTLPESAPEILKSLFQDDRRREMAELYLHHYLDSSPHERMDVAKWLVPVAAARLAEGIPLEEKQQLLQGIIRST